MYLLTGELNILNPRICSRIELMTMFKCILIPKKLRRRFSVYPKKGKSFARGLVRIQHGLNVSISHQMESD